MEVIWVLRSLRQSLLHGGKASVSAVQTPCNGIGGAPFRWRGLKRDDQRRSIGAGEREPGRDGVVP